MKPFGQVITNHPGRSSFNLSYEKKFDCDMGQLIPVLADEMVPGDVFKVGAEFVIRMQPLVAPILHEINVYLHLFFVPYRLLWEDWEEFITGGESGDSIVVTPPSFEPNIGNGDADAGSIWDFLGFPLQIDPEGARPLVFPFRAYNLIWNEYYRQQEIATEVSLDNPFLLYSAWEKDYFTSALLEQQRGTAPALPISGTTHAIWAASFTESAVWPAISAGNSQSMTFDSVQQKPFDAGTKATLEGNTITVEKAKLDANSVDLSGASTFDIADLRLATQMQKILERNNRAGARYTEWLHSHYAVSPKDDRLQRPEYIGGLKAPVIISEVLQTSETGTTPQGRMAGHGISANRQFIGSYRAQEFGVLMGIMKIVPKPLYQQGINRQWNSGCRATKWDFFLPELSHLSDQAIIQSEIYAIDDNTAENQKVFGYVGRYDEMRYKPNMVCNSLRSTFDYWHLSRQFSGAPTLTQTFLYMDANTPEPRKDIFAAPSVPGFIVSWGNLIHAIRPIPVQANPGLMDH